MKKLVFIYILIIFITSCVTRPYIADDKHFITSKPSSWVLSLVPGLTQIINGEYLEGALIAVGFIGFTAASAFMYKGVIENPRIDSNAKNNNSNARLSDSILAWSLLTYGYSYIDGVYSTYKLQDQKYYLEKSIIRNQERSRQAELEMIERERIARENEERKEEEKQARQIKLERYREIIKSNITRAKKTGSPILIYSYETRLPNYAGGVDCIIQFFNISDKRIKYIYFTVVPYNRVDDKAYSSIGRISETILDHTGYIEKNDIDNLNKLDLIFAGWSNVWYNYDISYMKITKIEIVFDDNSKFIMDGKMINSSIFYSEEELDSIIIDRIFDDGR